MKRELLFVFVAATALYLPAARYGFVQDDRAIIVANPAAHSVGAALAAFDDPYWPRETAAGLYRPLTILSLSLDWTVSRGRPGWLHLMNALWHGLATVLLVAVLARWLPAIAAAAAGLVFAWHPVHVEAVASLVGRAELLVAVGILGAVLAARRGWWAGAVLLAALAMFSKEHGVIAGVVILLDRWLQPPGEKPYPAGFWIGLAIVTVGFVAAWMAIGWVGENDAAAVFYGRGMFGRLAIALPAAFRALWLLVWPVSLSADYGPQVLPVRSGFSLAAVLGLGVVIGVPALAVWCRRRAPAIAFAAGLAALSYLPTANLFFPSGVVLAERNLYLAVVLPAALLGTAIARFVQPRTTHAPRTTHDARRTLIAALCASVAIACALLSFVRLPAWKDNRSQLLTLLAEHPESYRAHGSAAAVLAGIGDTAGARREYRIAESLYAADPYLNGAHAIFLLSIGDTASAVPLIEPRGTGVGTRMTRRAEFLLELTRGNRARAAQLADSAQRRYPQEANWYLQYR